jgi:hypothetical protein
MRVLELAGKWLNARAEEHRRTLVVLTLLVGLVPAWLAGSWVVQYGVDIPTKDDWDMASIIVKAQKGQLAWADFYEQLAEARMVVPKLIFIASAAGGHWDPRDQMMLSVVVCALTAVCLYWLLRRSESRRSPPPSRTGSSRSSSSRRRNSSSGCGLQACPRICQRCFSWWRYA